MAVNKLYAVCFSPTGGTKTITRTLAELIADQLNLSVHTIDLTLPHNRKPLIFSKEDLVIIGLPVYAGRLPNKLLPYLETLNGMGALAIAIAVFGNRSYDDALLELKSLLDQNDFNTIAAGSFIAQHAFSNHIGTHRPDQKDLEKVHVFSKQIVHKIISRSRMVPVSVKGSLPLNGYYKPLGLDGEQTNFLKAKPQTRLENCDQCGVCITVCPMGSIHKDDVSVIKGICIKCHACINHCPQQAKYFDDPAFLSHKAMLEKYYKNRIEPDTFI